jgi:hypothetical protein
MKKTVFWVAVPCRRWIIARWLRQQAPLKRRSISTRLHGATHQKTSHLQNYTELTNNILHECYWIPIWFYWNCSEHSYMNLLCSRRACAMLGSCSNDGVELSRPTWSRSVEADSPRPDLPDRRNKWKADVTFQVTLSRLFRNSKSQIFLPEIWRLLKFNI